MSYLAFNAAPLNFNKEEELPNHYKETFKNKTKNNKVNNIKQQIGYKPISDDDSDTESLADFNPPPKPVSIGANKKEENTTINESTDLPVDVESFQNLPSNTVADYYKQFVPMYDKANNNPTIHKDELLEKLDYMIHLLEEQKDHKTGSVTEEVVLYSFLGVFIIFVLDSFARAGKYVR